MNAVIACKPSDEKPWRIWLDGECLEMRWLTWQEAWEYSVEELEVSPNDHIPEPVKTMNQEAYDEWKRSGQRQLL